MTTMISELYDALLSAGAEETKARAAAKAVADYEERFHQIGHKLTEQDGKFTLLQWMVGFNLAFTMAVLWKVFA